MAGYLTAKELRELTDYRNRKPQIDWLKSKGLPFKLDDDRLIVMREHIEQWILGNRPNKAGGVNLGAVK